MGSEAERFDARDNLKKVIRSPITPTPDDLEAAKEAVRRIHVRRGEDVARWAEALGSAYGRIND